jgi:tetratricopeptide (TPR) repeat protein
MKRLSAIYVTAAVACAAIWGLRALAQQFPDNGSSKSNNNLSDDKVRPDRFDSYAPGDNIPGDKAGPRVSRDKVSPDYAQGPVVGGFVTNPGGTEEAGATSLDALKSRYQEAEGRLAEVAEAIAQAFGHGMPADQRDRMPERLEAAVSAVFEARQAMQQAELAHLERRVAKTKRALALREQAKQAIVEERTGNLMDEIESGAWQRRMGPGGMPPMGAMGGPGMGLDGMGPGGGIGGGMASGGIGLGGRMGGGMAPVGMGGGMGGAGMGPGGSAGGSGMGNMGGGGLTQPGLGHMNWDLRDIATPYGSVAEFDTATKERLQLLDVQEAQAKLEEARKAYDRSIKLAEQNAIAREDIDRFESELKLAELALERARIQYEAIARQNQAPPGFDPLAKVASDLPPAAVNAPDLEAKLLELDVEEAQLNLENAQSAQGTVMNEIGVALPSRQEAAALRAKIQLERAKTKLEIFKRHQAVPAEGKAGRQ